MEEIYIEVHVKLYKPIEKKKLQLILQQIQQKTNQKIVIKTDN